MKKDLSKVEEPTTDLTEWDEKGTKQNISTSRWRKSFRREPPAEEPGSSGSSTNEDGTKKARPEKWSMGVLNDRKTEEVPGSILLMSHANRNEPLGLRNAPARTSASSLPSPFPTESRSSSTRPSLRRAKSDRSVEEKKYTADGTIILEPQPEDTLNDPLNWPALRRDVALLSLGFYCMVGGGMTPVLAAGFPNVAETYGVSIPQVALTTGLYMLGLGLGSVIASPTAIIYGKRPVYLVGIFLFIISGVWCAVSPNYASLVVARIFMGLAVSPCECLPSATVAEIFYLHERAYRLGIYTLLLLGGKNLVPLVSAAIIETLGWRWVFWIIAMVVGFCLALMFLFVPETFWDRTPRPHHHKRKHGLASLSTFFHHPHEKKSATQLDQSLSVKKVATGNSMAAATHDVDATAGGKKHDRSRHHVGFVEQPDEGEVMGATGVPANTNPPHEDEPMNESAMVLEVSEQLNGSIARPNIAAVASSTDPEKGSLDPDISPKLPEDSSVQPDMSRSSTHKHSKESLGAGSLAPPALTSGQRYTSALRSQPPKHYLQTLRPWNGKLRDENWFYVALRPFILFAYPAILWSTLVYSLSVGWLIVLSESVAEIYKSHETYNFSSLQTGLVYISPFIGGILGTAVAGKVSDVIVRFMSRRNGGIYEPEFRLVMAIPIAISTCIGLMGFGWSAEERDNWIVPTVFFGVISFGCSLGSTTSITFAVDSYRQYAGEALVTLNFSKNILHGLVFSLFFNRWLDSSGSKNTFIAVGGIQLACLLTTIPMYIYGKRARMWTVRKNMMENF